MLLLNVNLLMKNKQHSHRNWNQPNARLTFSSIIRTISLIINKQNDPQEMNTHTHPHMKWPTTDWLNK